MEGFRTPSLSRSKSSRSSENENSPSHISKFVKSISKSYCLSSSEEIETLSQIRSLGPGSVQSKSNLRVVGFKGELRVVGFKGELRMVDFKGELTW